MRRTPLLLGLALLGPISQPLLANEHEHQQLDAHQHGAAELNMVVEGEEVLIELITPADNILGFEHQAKTEADKHKLEQAVASLRQGAIIQLSGDADCKLESIAIESALLEDHQEHDHDAEHAEHDGHDDHEKHEEHAHDDHNDHKDHDDHEHEGEHSEFHISYSYHCHQPDALNGAQVQLWQQFDGFEKIQVQLISPKGQQRQELTRSNPHIRF
ncbi:DUF2796 domain-containing protein [Motiliproteus coralliicola]|uniref:DUF2796 domain-containing protein n=1 Tax=Motiliproteus coralliicola TaxID=2283196 RepID=A0A369WPD3_9GAMM|nr:DUF2796 domain-containing protein [Motiliproteus coralliicola]RDE22474.1 DUF2796 domain-containing protein [Motiliproteus coralliicola]